MSVTIASGPKVNVKAREFIYSNVEAQLSPKGMRGFQVWAHAHGMPVPLQKTLEGLLNTAKTSQDFNVPAFTYVPVPQSDDILVAKITPLSGKDKFGRSGRFTAHALVVSREEFRKIDNNPFALIDSGFAFCGDPNDDPAGKPARLDRLPEYTTLECHTQGVRHDGALNPLDAVKAPLINHLENKTPNHQKKRVAVVGTVAEVEDMLRDVIHFLQPEDRARAFFDMSDKERSKRVTASVVAGITPEEKLSFGTVAVVHDPAKPRLTPEQLAATLSGQGMTGGRGGSVR